MALGATANAEAVVTSPVAIAATTAAATLKAGGATMLRYSCERDLSGNTSVARK